VGCTNAAAASRHRGIDPTSRQRGGHGLNVFNEERNWPRTELGKLCSTFPSSAEGRGSRMGIPTLLAPPGIGASTPPAGSGGGTAGSPVAPGLRASGKHFRRDDRYSSQFKNNYFAEI